MYSLFLISAADNSKDLATELVHYGFIHEVSLLAIPCHHSCACTALQQQSPNPCNTSYFRGVGALPFPAWQPGAVAMPSLQLHAVLVPFAVSDTFFPPPPYFAHAVGHEGSAVLWWQGHNTNYINLTLILNVKTRVMGKEVKATSYLPEKLLW